MIKFIKNLFKHHETTEITDNDIISLLDTDKDYSIKLTNTIIARLH